MFDLNRSDRSAEPISIALNTLIDTSTIVEKTRGYLGASAIGNPCMRRIQYDWMCDPEHPARLRDIFDRGHYFERRTREHFIRAGFRFASDDRLKFAALDGMLTGHADGIFIDGPKIADIAYPCLWEAKCINNKGWRSLDRDGLDKAYPQYVAQVTLYQHFLGVNETPAIFTAVNADSCERLHLLIPFDAEKAQHWIERVKVIIEATRAGELLSRFTDNPDHFRCRLCGHKDRCWRT
jgi:hypothetical protein